MKQAQFWWTLKTAIQKSNSTGLSVTLKKDYFDYDYLEQWVTSENESLWNVGHLEFDNFEFIDATPKGLRAALQASSSLALQKYETFWRYNNTAL